MINRKKIIAFASAVALAVVGHPSLAQDRYDLQPVSLNGILEESIVPAEPVMLAMLEEVVVTAIDLRDLVKPDDRVFTVNTGLGGRVMIHVYDRATDTWKYVGVK